MRYMSKKCYLSAQNAHLSTKRSPGVPNALPIKNREIDEKSRKTNRVCILRLPMRNTREITENEHRVCNFGLLMRNCLENKENEQGLYPQIAYAKYLRNHGKRTGFVISAHLCEIVKKSRKTNRVCNLSFPMRNSREIAENEQGL